MQRPHYWLLAAGLCAMLARAASAQQPDSTITRAVRTAESIPLPGDAWPPPGNSRASIAAALPCERSTDRTFCRFPIAGPGAWFTADSSGVVTYVGTQLWLGGWTPDARRALDTLEAGLLARLGPARRCGSREKVGARLTWQRGTCTVNAWLVYLVSPDSDNPHPLPLGYHLSIGAAPECP